MRQGPCRKQRSKRPTASAPISIRIRTHRRDIDKRARAVNCEGGHDATAHRLTTSPVVVFLVAARAVIILVRVFAVFLSRPFIDHIEYGTGDFFSGHPLDRLLNQLP